jgi:hypothetical protein
METFRFLVEAATVSLNKETGYKICKKLYVFFLSLKKIDALGMDKNITVASALQMPSPRYQ